VGSKTFDGVWFVAFSHDHSPPHVHGHYAGVQVIVELLPEGRIRKSIRWDAVDRSNAKRADVRRILKVARAHGDELMALWRTARG
jgi:hypothetical protein